MSTITRYTYHGAPYTFPLSNETVPNNPELVAAAGLDVDPDTITTGTLTREWNRHPAGSLVVTGLLTEGNPFAVIEEQEATR